MWAQLKDGFKEFATDALKEGGELVKDTADGTATAAAKVTEKAAVVTGTLSNRLDLDPTRAEEARGSAGPPKGLTGRQLSSLPQRTFLGPRDALTGDDAICAICQCEYEEGETIDIMPACAHTFHGECIRTWLKSKSTCPICMRNVKEDLRRAG